MLEWHFGAGLLAAALFFKLRTHLDFSLAPKFASWKSTLCVWVSLQKQTRSDRRTKHEYEWTRMGVKIFRNQSVRHGRPSLLVYSFTSKFESVPISFKKWVLLMGVFVRSELESLKKTFTFHMISSEVSLCFVRLKYWAMGDVEDQCFASFLIFPVQTNIFPEPSPSFIVTNLTSTEKNVCVCFPKKISSPEWRQIAREHKNATLFLLAPES